jgi:hypothetical protein
MQVHEHEHTVYLLIRKKTQIWVIFSGFGIKGNIILITKNTNQKLKLPLFIVLRLKDIMAILLTI